jgi:hypothetical protein
VCVRVCLWGGGGVAGWGGASLGTYGRVCPIAQLLKLFSSKMEIIRRK